jgi:succinoglycan biosynthesis transport protein ExoP
VDYETAKLGEISSQLTTVQGETTDSQSKRSSRGDTVAEVMQSPLINGLKADLSRGRRPRCRSSACAWARTIPNASAPSLNWLPSRAGWQARPRVSMLPSKQHTASAKTGSVNCRPPSVRRKPACLALNKQRDELNVYRRDVESAQRAYEAVSQSASQTRLQSLSNQTNVVRLNMATPLQSIRPARGFWSTC